MFWLNAYPYHLASEFGVRWTQEASDYCKVNTCCVPSGLEDETCEVGSVFARNRY